MDTPADVYALTALEARLDAFLSTGVLPPAVPNPYLTPKENTHDHAA